jgi:hypothetical protein
MSGTMKAFISFFFNEIHISRTDSIYVMKYNSLKLESQSSSSDMKTETSLICCLRNKNLLREREFLSLMTRAIYLFIFQTLPELI